MRVRSQWAMHALADIELASGPRRLVIPPELDEALERDPVARRAFGLLSYRQQRRYVSAIEAAADGARRRRRADRTVTLLRAR